MKGCERCGSIYKNDTYYCEKCPGCRVHYVPTKTQIKTACRELQKQWTEDEEVRRRLKLMH